jgi:hypothetical protein
MDYQPAKEVIVTTVEVVAIIRITTTKRAAVVELPVLQVLEEDHHLRTTTFPRMSLLWIVLVVSIVPIRRMEIVTVTIKIPVEVVSAVSVWTLRGDAGGRVACRVTWRTRETGSTPDSN